MRWPRSRCGQTVLLVGLAIAGNELAGMRESRSAQSLSMLGGTVAQLRLAFPRESEHS